MAGGLVTRREVFDAPRQCGPGFDPRRVGLRVVLGIGPVGERLQRTARRVDLGQLAAQLRGHQHAETPRILRREIFEHLGPVNAMNASANGWHGAPIAAADDAKIRSLGWESNKEWRPMPPVPFAQFSQLRPKTPSAALRRLAKCATCLRLRALRWAFSAVQRI